MKVIVSETLVRYHSIDLSDELDIEKILDAANNLKKRYDTGCKAIEAILEIYNNRFGDAFSYKITPNACGTEIEELNYEYTIEE